MIQMIDQQRKELLNEGPEEHFEDPYDRIRYLERTDQRHEANLIRRAMKKEEENDGK